MTNVTWGFVTSGPGFIAAHTEITTGTPTKEGIDLHGGGYGAGLRNQQWLQTYDPRDLGELGQDIYDQQANPCLFFGRGDFSGRRLGDNTETGQLFAPYTWLEPFENLSQELFVTERRALVSWSEFEVPTAPRRAAVSWGEFEIPTAPRRAAVSWGEVEIPTAPRRAQVSWGEFQIPSLAGSSVGDMHNWLCWRDNWNEHQ